MGTPVFYYHPLHGGHVFDSDELPDFKYGWADTPYPPDAEIKKDWKVPLDVAVIPKVKTPEEIEKLANRSIEPELADPTQFDGVDAYMTEFDDRLDTSLSPDDRETQLKRAMTHYAHVQYAMNINKRKSLERMAIDVREHEAVTTSK